MPSLKQYLAFARGIARDLLIYLVCKALYHAWPSKLRSMIEGKFPKSTNMEASMRYMSSLNFVRQRARRARKIVGIRAEEGEPYPDFPVVELKTKSEMMLSDLMEKSGNLPVVLNFGSCS